MPIRLGRWHIELHQRAIHATRQPNPDCPDCAGRGGHGWITASGDADWEDCHCLDQLRHIRIPYGPRRTEEYPF